MADVAENGHETAEPYSVVMKLRTFIQDQQLATTHNCSGKSQNLTLTYRQVATPAGNRSVKRNFIFIHSILEGEKTGCSKSIIQLGIVMLVEWVQVLAKGTAQQLRLYQNLSSHYGLISQLWYIPLEE